MLRPSHSLTIALALVACTDPAASDTKTTSESSSGSSATGTSSEGSSTPTDVGTGPGSTTGDITSGSTSQAETSASTSQAETSESTSTTSTGEGTTEDPTETGGEDPFKVGIALKQLCRNDTSSMCGVTPDDELVCWGLVDSPFFKVPPGKVKSVSPQCFYAVLESGELHRIRDFPSEPLDLPGGPFVLAGGEYPYGCAMAANDEVTCWVAEGYTAIETPPPGPYVALEDAREGNCQMCGLRGDGSLVCWRRPVKGDWGASCGGGVWNGAAEGTYTKFIGSTFQSVRLMNDKGQLVWFEPGSEGSLYVAPLFASGGFAEADALVGLRQSGELLYFENGMGDGVPILPGAYTTFRGDHNGGCAIRQSDSRVVCWGEGEYGQFDPPKE
ncbi:hypothetical protein OV203_33925 [Nannocystis sp. ILAH1]|uniref:hypothetical protein n=1 Tax=Nannocystis sp. ILAH1 TaxID=2996789 RepID=UPI00227037BB|nr:hypothetical protein [Nannocystis sp. ILAH1]MCY0990903.1 hypothetical protein [Nannocystis sp. ILAH1]MCY0992186.1 hypothetical protein [Nannocystis sp. ILAH1]